MAHLGLSPEQVETHARALYSRRTLTALADSAPELERTMQDARKAYATYNEEAEKEIAKIRERQRLLLSESHTAETQYFNASRASNKLYELNAQNAELFGLSADDLESQRPKPAMNWPKNEAPAPIPINGPAAGTADASPANRPPTDPRRPFAHK